jgi:hypothetical protein
MLKRGGTELIAEVSKGEEISFGRRQAMRHGRQVQVLMVLAMVAAGSAASAAEPAVEAELEVPFVLAVGQTGRVEPEGLEVTLRSASDDSGCLAPDDCSLATFKGTIAMRLGEEKDLATVQAIMEPDQMTSFDFAGYEIRFGSVRRLDKGDIQATFTVTKASEEEEEEDDDER